MNNIIVRLKKVYFPENLDFRPRMFNALAFIGIAAGIIFVPIAFATGAGIVNAMLNLAASALGVGLLIFANRTGRFSLCFLITAIVVFLLMFPALFFVIGGYRSGMPSFFIFAVAFTVLMLEGKQRLIIAGLEIVSYTTICLFDYFNPGFVPAFASERDAAVDIITSCFFASLFLAFAIGHHIAVYDKKQQRLQQMDQEKTELFGNISHELKTPLAIISTLAQRMKSKYESIPDAQGAVTDALLISAEADRMGMLVSQVLELTRIAEGRIVGERKPCNIDEIIHHAMSTHFAVSLNNNRIDLKIEEGLPPVLADASRIAQVVVNLVDNAERHTSNGRIVISIVRQGTHISVTVADNGIGIDKAKMLLIFERYYTGGEHGGTGLGLYICRHIVEAHDGKISVTSQPGKGSRFTFPLPAHTEAG